MRVPGTSANAAKAEVFELTLARVSARVDVVARAAAEELRAERLAAAAAAPGSTGPGAAASSGSKTGRPERPSTRDQDHRWPEARRVVARQGCCTSGEEGLPLRQD